jgi:molybdate transport repressor ModE-like protein
MPSTPNIDHDHSLSQAFNSRMDRLRMRHLRLLDSVAQSGSLSAAAEAIGMSQPGATKMLHELEEAFECKLIERSVKGGALTPAGANVLDRLRIALNAVGAARTVTDSNKEYPLVRLGIIPLVGIQALGHVIAGLRADNRKIRIQIKLGTVDSLIKELTEGKVDCAVGFLDETTKSDTIRNLNVVSLWEETLVVVSANGHALAQRKKVPLAMMRNCDWILMPKGSANRRAVENLFLNAGMAPPTPGIETESFHIAMSLLPGTDMLAAVPESAFRQYQSQLSVVKTDAKFPTTRLVFVTLALGQSLPSVNLLSQGFRQYSESVLKALA